MKKFAVILIFLVLAGCSAPQSSNTRKTKENEQEKRNDVIRSIPVMHAMEDWQK